MKTRTKKVGWAAGYWALLLVILFMVSLAFGVASVYLAVLAVLTASLLMAVIVGFGVALIINALESEE